MIHDYFNPKSEPGKNVQPQAPAGPQPKEQAPEEPRMTRSEHWAAINAERKARKEAEAKKSQPAPKIPFKGPKTGPFGTPLLK